MNLASLVDAHAGDRRALHGGDRWIDWSEVRDRARAVAAGITALGVGPGDRVAIAWPTSPEFVVSYLGTLAAGAVAVPLNQASPPAEVERELEFVEPSAVICGGSSAEVIARICDGGRGGDAQVRGPGRDGPWDRLAHALRGGIGRRKRRGTGGSRARGLGPGGDALHVGNGEDPEGCGPVTRQPDLESATDARNARNAYGRGGHRARGGPVLPCFRPERGARVDPCNRSGPGLRGAFRPFGSARAGGAPGGDGGCGCAADVRRLDCARECRPGELLEGEVGSVGGGGSRPGNSDRVPVEIRAPLVAGLRIDRGLPGGGDLRRPAGTAPGFDRASAPGTHGEARRRVRRGRPRRRPRRDSGSGVRTCFRVTGATRRRPLRFSTPRGGFTPGTWACSTREASCTSWTA